MERSAYAVQGKPDEKPVCGDSVTDVGRYVMGFYLPEDGHVVMLFNPADLSAASSSEVFSMENYNHVDILVHKGAGSACAIQV